MRGSYDTWNGLRASVAAVLAVGFALAIGCSGSSAFPAGGTPFFFFPGEGSLFFVTPGTTASQTGSALGDGGGVVGDPCNESQTNKFITISMRNLAQFDYIHYFFVMIAYVNGDTYPDGAVCEADIDTYRTNGYILVEEGSEREFGNLCIEGPALYYFHENGRFQGAGAALASAIGPAQGSQPTYDAFFTSAGRRMPVPNLIIFHNPGGGNGGHLLVSRPAVNPCDIIVVSSAEGDCLQDAFYYVDDTDRMAGQRSLGMGSGRRVPNEIQGTGCECLGGESYQVLAPPGVTATTTQCNYFFRGGRIDYVFVRDDRDPPFPQLLWRVTDSSGARAHDFDARAGVQ